MSSETKQGWEPSEASLQAIIQEVDRLELSFRTAAGDVNRAAFIAGVAADPLLSAAKDMQDALADLVALVERVGDSRKDAPFIEAGLAALSKSRGR
jgi:hypothetical protein